ERWIRRSVARAFRGHGGFPCDQADLLRPPRPVGARIRIPHELPGGGEPAFPHLVPIEHINWYESGLCYVMPLADGRGGDGPEDRAWRPLGLDFLLEGQRERKEWFTSREIVKMLRLVLHALQTLSEAKLVHRDVK